MFGIGLVAVLALVLFGRVLPGVAAAYCGARAGRAGPAVAGLLAVAVAVVGCIIG